MDQYRDKRNNSRDIVPPLVGLILIGGLCIPGISPLFGSWFFWIVGLLGLVVACQIIRVMWRRRPIKEAQKEPLLPIFIHSDEEREQFRAMMGVKERPPTPIKVVMSEIDDAASASDSPPKH